ncbi:MAG: hypothetical protein P8Q37_10275 [Porticoccaceae bacterium]|nr:hypothetical protein [Porticoccaceae bacterium]MDG1475280.1 hypothetical protein [Porticoccaceae bacterium]
MFFSRNAWKKSPDALTLVTDKPFPLAAFSTLASFRKKILTVKTTVNKITKADFVMS